MVDLLKKPDPTQSLLLFLDFETTGLDPETVTPLELYARLFDFNMKPVGEPFHGLVRPNNYLKYTEQVVLDQHEQSGLMADCRRNGVSVDAMLKAFDEWLRGLVKVGKGVNIHLAGKNVMNYEYRILKARRPGLAKVFHYRSLETQTFYICDKLKGTNLFQFEKTHRAKDDVEHDIAAVRRALALMPAPVASVAPVTGFPLGEVMAHDANQPAAE